MSGKGWTILWRDSTPATHPSPQIQPCLYRSLIARAICRGHPSASAFLPVPPLPSCPDPQIGKKHQGVQRTHVPAPRTDRVFWILKNVRRLSARQDEDSLISRGGGEGSSGPVSCLPVHTGAGLNHIEVYRFTRLSCIVVVQIRLLISRRRRRRCQNDDSLGASSERQQRKHAAWLKG